MILVRGGGDLASGVIYRLFRAGIRVIVTELPQPLVVRRLVSFAEAVYRGQFEVEGVPARRVTTVREALSVSQEGIVPVLVDPQAACRSEFSPLVLIDARLVKKAPDLGMDTAPLVIGLGPGFIAGANCHAAVETNRGHMLGRVIWDGSPLADTGIPEAVVRHQAERVLRAPASGKLSEYADIGRHLDQGQLVTRIAGEPVFAPFAGVLRGLVHPSLEVQRGMKIGDLDPRDDPLYSRMISEKSLSVGGGVLEAILSRPEIRGSLWI